MQTALGRGECAASLLIFAMVAELLAEGSDTPPRCAQPSPADHHLKYLRGIASLASNSGRINLIVGCLSCLMSEWLACNS